MQGDFRECLELVLKSEGGFSNNINDSGGMTNLGVTKRTWEEYTGHEADEKTIRNLTPEKVAPLYEQRYWRPTYCETLPRGLRYLVFSMAINAGPGRSVKLLQSTIGCVADGVIGPRTRSLIASSDIANLIAKYSQSRRDYYESLKTFPIFGRGWLARVDREEKDALNMIKNG